MQIDQAQCDHAGWACFSREVFDKDPNVCSNPLQVCITFASHHSVVDCIPFFAGIASAGYPHVSYHDFKGVDALEKYDIYEKVLKVKDVAILTFADFVHRLLVDYIRVIP